MFEIPDSRKTNWDVIYYSYKYSGIVKDQNTQKYVYWELDYTIVTHLYLINIISQFLLAGQILKVKT